MLNRMIASIRALPRCEGGFAALFVGLGLLTLVAATGVSVDMSRLQTVRGKLSHALDAAGLAAGAKLHSTDPNTVVNNYVGANFPDGFLDSSLTSVTVTPNTDNTILTLSATARVDMTFMQLFGIDTVDVTATSEITRENRGLEMVMVLDVTGSMYSGGKIQDLRTAATDMVNILFGSKETLDNLWMAIVPYSTSVNVGPTHTDWLRDYDLSRYPANYPSGATKWKGCVEARNQYPENNGYDVTDDVPDASDPETLFPMWLWESNWDNQWINPSNGSVSLNENAGYSDTGAKGPNVGCGNEVTPFTASKTTMLNAITALTPWRRGGTMSSIGMAWGWRMLSPKWRGMWGNPNLPLDYDTPLMNKAVIVMTDGVNEVFTPYSNPPYGSDYTSYQRIGQEKLGPGVNTRSEGVTAVNDRFSTLCSNMKAQGILVYTVTFRLNTSTAANNARALFRSCASHPDYYFDSPDGATLQQAFRQIGDSLANLMISQ